MFFPFALSAIITVASASQILLLGLILSSYGTTPLHCRARYGLARLFLFYILPLRATHHWVAEQDREVLYRVRHVRRLMILCVFFGSATLLANRMQLVFILSLLEGAG